MKKTYIQPSLEALKMEVNQLVLNNSILVDPNTGTNTQLSRKFLFDDDFEDEYEDE